MKEEAEIVKELRELDKIGAFEKNENKIKTKSVYELKQNNLNQLNRFEKKIDNYNCLKLEHLNQDLYKELIRNSLEGILILDFNGTILFVNPAVLKIFGFNYKQEILGQNFINLIHPDYQNKLKNDQNLLLSENEGFINTYKTASKNGKTIWIEGIGCRIELLNEKSYAFFIRDITGRQKTWSELVKIGDKYKALADISTDGILIIDNLGRIIYSNKSFEKLSGKNKEQLNGIPFRNFLSKESIYEYQEIFIGSRKTGKIIKDIELEFINNKNEKIPIEISLSPLKNFNDELSGIAFTIHDITVHKKIENELIKSKKLKTEFMNIAAHELKSPITPIKGYLDLIVSDDKANNNTKKWGKISLRNTERLLDLINEILDVSRLDSDTMSFNMEKIDPEIFLNERIEDIQPIIKKKKLVLEKNISNNLSNILGDKYRLEQVIKNLLGNSVKFTEKGKIIITANEIDNKLQIIIEDTGIGISNHELDKIFLKFYQAYTGNDRKYEGTGLGLFICKEIIKRHNGNIWAESRINHGTKFYVELPVI